MWDNKILKKGCLRNLLNIYNKMTYIYLVTNCYDKPEYVYIGKTTQISARKSRHKSIYGETIEFAIIDQVDSFERSIWGPLENYWIEQFIQWGFNVQNKNVGGNGPTHRTPEQRNHLRAKMLGRKRAPFTPEHGLKISRAKKGKPQPKGTGEKISISLTGKPKTESHKQNMRKPKPNVRIANQGKPRGKSDGKIYKGIGQLDKITGELIKIWDSQTAATLSVGKINTIAISECCNGKRKSAWGYKWVWLLG
jgi:hypothetical protein